MNYARSARCPFLLLSVELIGAITIFVAGLITEKLINMGPVKLLRLVRFEGTTEVKCFGFFGR